MDAREARKYVMSNPPPEMQANAERRPSFLARLLFRRSSSTEDQMSSSPPKVEGILGEGNSGPERTRSNSITEAVQREIISKPRMMDNPIIDPESTLWS